MIRLSALGDFILALPAMAAIRQAHPEAHITLLTTDGLAALGRKSGWFDHVEIDRRPRWHQVAAWLRLRRWLRAGGFERVYDLQSQDRTALYFRLYWPGKRPEWSGIAPGASHPHRDPDRGRMHALDIHAGQLAEAGIFDISAPDLTWLDEPLTEIDLPPHFALLAPGSAPHRPDKRWPAAHFAQLAAELTARGIRPLILGTSEERPLAAAILSACPTAMDLTGRTSLFAVAALARRAAVAIGNDTGPMHLIAMLGCPSVVLFSAASNPARAAPRGPHVTILQRPSLNDLPMESVAAAVADIARSVDQ